MTWLLILFGMAGPVIIGELATDQECYEVARDFMLELQAEHHDDTKWHPPVMTCVGVPDQMPSPADGQRI